MNTSVQVIEQSLQDFSDNRRARESKSQTRQYETGEIPH
jgi:hypothetical protein